MAKAILFIGDYTDQGNDQFFVWSEGEMSQVEAYDLVQETGELICHDYWLIAPAIFRKTGSLPSCVTEIDELKIASSGRKKERENRESVDFSGALADFVDEETVRKYKAIFNRRASVDLVVLAGIGRAIVECGEKIKGDARRAGEWDRYEQIERPVSAYLFRSAAEGIAICEGKLRAHKRRIEFEYYLALKEFSAKYDCPLEVPSDVDVIRYLELRGYDFSNVNVDYVLKFVPMENKFAEDLLHLRKIAKSRKVLISIPLSQKRVFPIVDCFGSITSRIYFKDPALQSLAKHHRDILIADQGFSLSYIDYDQYEAGIMAALSGDEELLRLYANADIYEEAAEQIFRDRTKRREAKRLFLSYAYGMKRNNLVQAAYGYGAERNAARSFFDQFTALEKWKKTVADEFRFANKIGTSFGNYLRRDQEGELTEKERRSAVSQVVQGTASLIFKKALLALRDIPCVQLKVPMHDAVLFQHPNEFDTSAVVALFSQTLSDHFGGVIKGKASLSTFYPS